MNDILGILIPMLMSGADIGEIFRALGGAGSGSAGMDGLEAMLSTQKRNARLAVPLVQNQSTINRASESVIDRIGINPYSGLGQGLSTLLGSMYHIAPDTIGAVLGVPNGGQFFSTVANGASAISQASGGGSPDIFNPYSVIAAHQRTMNMARQVYDLGVRKEGGYDVNFGHGLNMGEMGKVTQRLLASDIPYREYAKNANGELNFSQETGERLDPNKAADADKFSQNLKKLGSKFNEAASMLAKVTGSVDEALAVMDRLGGGNFLGGTAEQASAVANKARKMATAIRVTSAIAGISPQEAYANMSNLQQSMAAGMGLSPYVANASGATGLMQDMAFNGTMAFNAWAAMNPNASPERRKQALFAANGRAQAYATSNGAALAAAVADNANLFTQEELEQFKTSYREGRPNDMAGLVRQRIGTNMYTEYMTDPAMQLAARKRASEENPELLKAIDEAGEEGNLAQAESFGANRILRKTLSDMDSTVTKATGKSGFTKSVDAAAQVALQKLAVEQGLTQESAEKMKVDDLRRFLRNRPGASAGEVERSENIARIQAAEQQLGERTMSVDEEKDARQRLKNEISANTEWSAEAKQKFISQLDQGVDLTTVYNSYSGGLSREASKGLRERIYNGKMTSGDAARERTKLERLERAQKTDYTANERLDAIENSVKRSNLENVGALKGLILYPDFGRLDDRSAMQQFTAQVQKLQEAGTVNLKGDQQLTKVYSEASQRLVANIFDGRLGELKGDALAQFSRDVGQRLIKGVENGKGKVSFEQAFANAIDVKNLSQEQIAAIAGLKVDDVKKMSDQQIADLPGIKTLKDWRNQALDRNSDFSKKVNAEAFFFSSASVIDSREQTRKTEAVNEMRKLASGEFGKLNDEQAVNRFMELSKTVGLGSDISQDDVKKMMASAQKGGGKDVWKTVISSLLSKMKPQGQRVLGFEATSAAGNINQAALVMTASRARMSGLDMSKLNLGPGSKDLLSNLDKINADSSMNRIPNALRVGGASYYREAVKNTESEIANLRKALTEGGVDMKTLQASFGTDDKAKQARAKVESALKNSDQTKYDVSHGMAMLETLKDHTIGGQSGLNVLMDEKEMSKAKGQKGAEADLVEVTKSANMKDSGVGNVLGEIGKLVKDFAPFLTHPENIFLNVKIKEGTVLPVRIAEGQITVNAE